MMARPALESWAQSWARLLAAATFSVLLLGACASLPPQDQRPVSYALEPSGTNYLLTTARNSITSPGKSGFQLLPIGSFAYAARIDLIERATESIDLQYFTLEHDAVGDFMLVSLERAALRGVRVRLLVDDLYTSGEDALFSGLAAYPNVEVRLFNPFPGARGSLTARFIGAFDELKRVNHRMHNKMMVVDGALAVVGGRNIGVEYFMRAEDRNFVDIDLLAAGPVVSQLSAIFDRYWNSDFAYPVETIVKDALTPQARRDEFARLVANAQAPPPDTSVPPRYAMFTTTLNGLKLKHLGLIEADAKAIADPVAKAAGANDNTREGTVREMVVQEMLKAQEEIFVASPYFVPGTIGLETTRSLSARGIHMFLLTNSLASTDSPLAHVGYARARRKLVEDGVQIYELSPSLVKARGRLGQFRTSSGSLHEKVIVVDRRVVFIGSMNLDSRSERKNTELGLLIDSPALASQYLDNLDYEGSAYLVRQNAVNHALEWVEGQLGFEVTFSEEPEATFWQRLRTKLLEPFVPDEEL